MTFDPQSLPSFSEALTQRVMAAKSSVAGLRISARAFLAATFWKPDVLIASEQSLPSGEEFEALTSDGFRIAGKLSGRDPGTNIAAIRLEQSAHAASISATAPQVGATAIALGVDETGGCSARFGIVNALGPEWRSMRGGRIDARIRLDIRLAPSEEGGPVFDAAGAWLGNSTFGPRGQILVIPAATINRVAPVLLERGHVPRGWLGVALRPVQVPDELQEATDESTGLMVMSLGQGGPAASAGIVAGDIILSIDGASAVGRRGVMMHLGADSIGRRCRVRLIRGGRVREVELVIAERPSQ